MIIIADGVRGSLAGALYKEDEVVLRKDENGNMKSYPKEVEFIYQNEMTGQNAKERYIEMSSIAKLSPRLTNKFLEVVISPDKIYSTKLEKEDWKSLAQDYVNFLGVPIDQQWYAVKHGGKDPHLHLAINRVGFDGENKIPTQKIGEKSGRIADELCRGRGWKTLSELMTERYKLAYQSIREAEKISINFDDFKKKLKNKGYIFELSENSKGLNGGRICPLDEWVEIEERTKREKKANKGYTLSQINKGLKIEKKPNALKIQEINNQLIKNKIDYERKNNTKITTGSSASDVYLNRGDKKSMPKIRYKGFKR